MVPKSWWVYMVQTQGGRLYTGITTDTKRRFKEHCDCGKLGARFFRTDPAHAMVFVEDTTFLTLGRNSRRQEVYEADVRRIQMVAQG